MNGFGSTDLEDITCKCGKHPRLVESAVGTYILCPWCGTATYMCSNKKEALEKWNEKMKTMEV